MMLVALAWACAPCSGRPRVVTRHGASPELVSQVQDLVSDFTRWTGVRAPCLRRVVIDPSEPLPGRYTDSSVILSSAGSVGRQVLCEALDDQHHVSAAHENLFGRGDEGRVEFVGHCSVGRAPLSYGCLPEGPAAEWVRTELFAGAEPWVLEGLPVGTLVGNGGIREHATWPMDVLDADEVVLTDRGAAGIGVVAGIPTVAEAAWSPDRQPAEVIVFEFPEAVGHELRLGVADTGIAVFDRTTHDVLHLGGDSVTTLPADPGDFAAVLSGDAWTALIEDGQLTVRGAGGTATTPVAGDRVVGAGVVFGRWILGTPHEAIVFEPPAAIRLYTWPAGYDAVHMAPMRDPSGRDHVILRISAPAEGYSRPIEALVVGDLEAGTWELPAECTKPVDLIGYGDRLASFHSRGVSVLWYWRGP